MENVILEAVNRSEIESAIEYHNTCRIYYEGDETVSRGWRWIEPYVYGESLAENPIVRAYQIQGVTDTEEEGWKTFRTDKISRWVKTPRTFYSPISDRKSGVPRYKENGDRSMIRIYKQAKF